MTSRYAKTPINKELVKGIQKFTQFKNNLIHGNFSTIYIFLDGSYLKKRTSKLFYKKSKKFGSPAIIIKSLFLKNIPDTERRLSIAEDINQDLIWMQKSSRTE